MATKRVLVVGAGFAGGTIARVLADRGLQVDLLEKRPHIGGNAYDYVNELGERIHRYGPHLLHGNKDSKAVEFLSRFTKWTDYEHRVRALLSSGLTTPLPVNRTTLEDVYGVKLDSDEDAKDLLRRITLDIAAPNNTDELFLANVGERLADLFFRPYTMKMWGTDPKNLATSIGARLPVRTSRDDRYFTDSFQKLPSDGYTQLFNNMLDHTNIKVTLNTCFHKDMVNDYDHSFLCLPIDEYFDHELGVLPYRSIRFDEIQVCSDDLEAPVINFTDNGPYTRQTQWSLLPNSGRNQQYKTITREQPCSLQENKGEYYYPVQTRESTKMYEAYAMRASKLQNVTFCGRTGLFRYIDMLPAVTMHLDIASRYIDRLRNAKDDVQASSNADKE